MSIEKKYRVITEKTTSVEDPIELVQKGTVKAKRIAARAAVVLAIPTSIENPKTLTIVPLNIPTGKAIQRYHCDMIRYSATNASIAKLLDPSATTAVVASFGSADTNADLMITYDGKLYIVGANGCASSVIKTLTGIKTSTAISKVPFITATNSKGILKVVFPTATAASLNTTFFSYSYEVRGY